MLHTLRNSTWQAGILPQTGASIAFGQVNHGGGWRDVLRPTPDSDMTNSSKCSSFIMLPWCNRIRGAVLRFDGVNYPLEATQDDGTARHGEVRKRAWRILSADDTAIRMGISGGNLTPNAWPFPYSAEAEYRLDGADFIWTLRLTNTGDLPMPAGFGHHPYFVRSDQPPVLTVPCSQQFELTDSMATAEPVSISPTVDFRSPRSMADIPLDDLLTGRDFILPNRLHYPDSGLTVEMYADPIFVHTLLYAPAGAPFFAVEPQSNANDGFALHANGIPGNGVFVLSPGETTSGTVRLRVI